MLISFVILFHLLTVFQAAGRDVALGIAVPFDSVYLTIKNITIAGRSQSLFELAKIHPSLYKKT